MDPGADRRLAAVLYADVVGFSRLMAHDEAETVRALNACLDDVAPLVSRHQGRLVDTAGDSVLAEFPTATGAVEAALGIQETTRASNAEVPEDRQMWFRVGIHVGELRIESGRIYGDAVNIAARIQALADAGGLCVSSTVYEQVRNKLPLAFQDLGAKDVKNIPYVVRVYRVGTPSAAPESLRAGRPMPATGTSRDRRASIAVLPFDVFTPADDGIAYGDILATEVIHALSRPHGLRVASRLATSGYRGGGVDPRTIGHELGVDYVLSGNLRLAGERAKVMIEIHDARTGSQLWTRNWELPIAELLEMPETMAEAIVAVFEGEFVRAEVQRARELPDETLDARGMLHKARTWFLGVYSRDHLLQALDLTQRAVAMRPDYAVAHATLALVAIELSLNGWGGTPEQMEKQALEAASRAVELRPGNPICLENQGLVLAHVGELEGALRALRRAVEIAPTDLVAWAHLGFALGWGGGERASAEESDAILRRIIETAPEHPLAGFWPFFHSSARLRLGHVAEAVDACRLGIEAQPGFVFTRLALANALALDGNSAEAHEVLERVSLVQEDMTPDRYAALVTRQSQGAPAVQINLDGLQKLGVLRGNARGGP